MKKYIVEFNNKEYEVNIREEGETNKNVNTKSTKNAETKTVEKTTQEKETVDKKETKEAKVGNEQIDVEEYSKVSAPMSGKVLSIRVEEGEKVNKEQVLMTLEAMKMETEIVAQVSGRLKQIVASEGSKCKQGDILALIEAGGN